MYVCSGLCPLYTYVYTHICISKVRIRTFKISSIYTNKKDALCVCVGVCVCLYVCYSSPPKRKQIHHTYQRPYIF